MIDLRSALELYLVADPDHTAGSFDEAVEASIVGGVTAVQLRAKNRTDREIVEVGKRLRAITAARSVPLLVNDRIDLALAVGADGVHLGISDLSPEDARRFTPPEFIIGYSPDDPSDTAGANADYLGIGPLFGTASKADAGTALGLGAFASRVQAAPVPVVGIGGINEGNAAPILEAGAAGVAVISAILANPDPEEAARKLRRALRRDG